MADLNLSDATIDEIVDALHEFARSLDTTYDPEMRAAINTLPAVAGKVRNP